MRADSRYFTVVLVLLYVACAFGGGSPAGEEEEAAKTRYANKVGTTKQAGVMRCDPFGDYGAFWGVTSEKFDGKLKTISGKSRKMTSYKGKSVLVANVAANADDASEQIQMLNGFAESYPDKLEVLGFWSSSFADKGVESVEDFRKQLKTKLPADFKLKFIIADQTTLNGPRTHALYRWLKDQCAAEDVQGDFVKFLMTRQGRVHKRYEPTVDASVIQDHIDKIVQRTEI